MIFKEVKFWQDAQSAILRWINIVADAVTTTLGPRWTHVVFEDWAMPTVTKDGVTVAQQILLEDKFENIGVLMAREAAEATNREAGDWTTSSLALLRAMVNEWSKYIVAWMNPILIKRWMDQALTVVLDELDKVTKTIETKEEKIDIATISANNDKEIGEMIVEVIENVWKDWVVTVTTNNTFKTDVDYVTGTKIDTGFESSVFINDAKRLVTDIENPTILITSDQVSQQAQLIPVLQKLIAAGKTNIVLFANSIEGQALAFIIQNYVQGKFMCVPVRLPSFGWYQRDVMRDLSTLIWATVLGQDDWRKIEQAEVSDCGTCDFITISRDNTIITGGQWDISARIDEVKTLMDSETDNFRMEMLKSRLGKLTGKVANIKVGGASQTEQTEIKYRIEDALNATRSAIEEGIVEWAGTALLRCAESLTTTNAIKEYAAWTNIVKQALSAPFKKIISNGWENADAIMWKVLESDKSYNSLTQQYEDLFESWIIDPKKVVVNCIKNAVATSWIILTSSVAITSVISDK